MKDVILNHLHEPGELEKLYRSNKAAFKREFNDLYPEVRSNSIAEFWNARLNHETDEINWGTGRDLIFILIGALIAGTIAKFPTFFSIDEEFFYPRNLGFIIFPVLTAFFAWKNKLSIGKIAFIVGATLIGLTFINHFLMFMTVIR